MPIQEATQKTKSITCMWVLRVDGTLRWKTLRKTLHISAVIVHHVILLHPFKPLLACRIQLLFKPSVVGWRRWRFRGAGGDAGWPNTCITLEVPVGSGKRCLGPVSFYEPTSCGPVIGVPKARVHSHGLTLWEWNATWLGILELSDGSPINIKAERRTSKGKRLRVCLVELHASQKCFV